MYRTHVRSSKDLLCSLCGGKIRWPADTMRYGVRLKRYAHKECYPAAASSEAAEPFLSFPFHSLVRPATTWDLLREGVSLPILLGNSKRLP